MHPGYIRYWKQQQRRAWACGPTHASASCDPTHGPGPEWTSTAGSRHSGGTGDPVFGAGGFGVRRPVRYLALKLDLDEKQVTQLGRIVERLRVERQQAAVDLRRAAAEFADALEQSDFGDEAIRGAGERRIEAARSVQQAVARALRELHELLDENQREELASLIRMGAVTL